MPVASRAQEPGGAVACPSIQNDQERLACYDRAMRGGQPAAKAAPPPDPTPAPAPAPATPPAAVAAPAVVVGAAAASAPPAPAPVAPVTAAAPTASPAASSPAPPSAAPAAPAAAAAATSAAVAAPSSGAAAATPSSTISTAPHNARNTHAATPPPPGSPPTFDPNTGAPTGVFSVVVVSAVNRPGLGTEFHTDTGGVWVQTEAKPLTLPKTPFNAQLQPGTLGSTFLVLPDRKMGIRVRPPNK
jgi:hypothetical protein